MPLAEIREHQILVRIADGELAMEDLITSVIGSHQARDFNRMLFFINDFSRVTRVTGFSEEAVQSLLASDIGSSFSNPNFSVLLIRSPSAVLNGLLDAYQKSVEGIIPVLFFESLDAARDHINRTLVAAPGSPDPAAPLSPPQNET